MKFDQYFKFIKILILNIVRTKYFRNITKLFNVLKFIYSIGGNVKYTVRVGLLCMIIVSFSIYMIGGFP